jgi:3-hydroxyacyl-[acyl-carrier-protein] dehydratase
MIPSQDPIERLPHRPPMRFVDRLLEVEPGERVVAEHDVSAEAFWVPGHFPGEPVMPGVLITEALAQTAALVFLADPEAGPQAVVYLVGLDKMRFRRPVRPGDTLRLQAKVADRHRRMWTFEVEASVEGQRVANGSLLATLPEAR